MAKKRVNGEGTIGKRKDGRWKARYIAGRDPETGKQIRKSILGKTQAEVRLKLKVQSMRLNVIQLLCHLVHLQTRLFLLQQRDSR